MGDRLAVLEYHTSGPFTNTQSQARVNYYGITGVPTAVFNGTDRVVGGGGGTFGAYYNEFNQQIAIGTPGVLSLKIVDYNPSLRTGTITAKFNALEQINESGMYLRYAITESHKYYEWYWLDTLQFIVRDMLPDYNGVSFYLGEGETFVDSQSFYIDMGWVDYHCDLVVFAQSDKGKKVVISNSIPLYQTHVSGDANGDGMVTISDVIFLANHVLYDGPEPSPSAAGDPNEDCVIDNQDVIYLFNYVFLGGPAPLRGWEID
jgi:hypothetical protein